MLHAGTEVNEVIQYKTPNFVMSKDLNLGTNSTHCINNIFKEYLLYTFTTESFVINL